MLDSMSVMERFFKRLTPTYALHHSDEMNYVQLRQALINLHDAMGDAGLHNAQPALMYPRQILTGTMDFFIDKLMLICHFIEISDSKAPIRSIVPQLNEALVYLVFCAKSSSDTVFRQKIINSLRQLN
ncbi:MAG: hypothetical protein ACTS9Y_01285 [Methylophilus sp.]|uniref:hypothetical protein n=1 Tax=Methylophilus sp. TaxID=29541 RepID=UPI003F9FCB2C